MDLAKDPLPHGIFSKIHDGNFPVGILKTDLDSNFEEILYSRAVRNNALTKAWRTSFVEYT